MSKPKIDWSQNPHSKLDQDASWLKAENSTLRAEVEALKADQKQGQIDYCELRDHADSLHVRVAELKLALEMATEKALRYAVENLWEFNYADTHLNNVQKREGWVQRGIQALRGESK